MWRMEPRQEHEFITSEFSLQESFLRTPKKTQVSFVPKCTALSLFKRKMEAGLLRLLIFAWNENHLQLSCPRGKNRSESDWQLKATRSCLQLKLLSDRIGRFYLLVAGERTAFQFVFTWETEGMEHRQDSHAWRWKRAGLASRDSSTCSAAKQE